MQSGAVWPSLEKQLAIQKHNKRSSVRCRVCAVEDQWWNKSEWTDRKYLKRSVGICGFASHGEGAA